ncbi:MAG: YeeE/YedE thiosulfate transporter family protein, partial [Desulfobacterales bacterium]
MLEKVYSNRPLQLLLGLAIGFCFGFLLQKGGVTRYDVIMGQLLLQDWTVVKVILTAILTGMIGIYLLRIPGLAKLHTWSGSFGSTVIGGLIFGVGFAILGYCPGTLAGAVG